MKDAEISDKPDVISCFFLTGILSDDKQRWCGEMLSISYNCTVKLKSDFEILIVNLQFCSTKMF